MLQCGQGPWETSLWRESLENLSHSLWVVRNDQDLPGEEGEHCWNDWGRVEGGREWNLVMRDSRRKSWMTAWGEKNKQKEGDWKWVRGKQREGKGEGTWGLDQGPNHSTAEYVWKWSRQSRIGMGRGWTHTYIHECKITHSTSKNISNRCQPHAYKGYITHM